MIHHLKIEPRYFHEVETGTKSFEFRKNDRDFKPGDTLILEEYQLFEGRYTGRSVERKVPFILYGGRFGLPEGYCIMSLELPESGTGKRPVECAGCRNEIGCPARAAFPFPQGCTEGIRREATP